MFGVSNKLKPSSAIIFRIIVIFLDKEQEVLPPPELMTKGLLWAASMESVGPWLRNPALAL